MRSIYKYKLEHPPEPYPTTREIEMPEGSQLLHVHEQGEDIYVWAEVNTSRKPVKYRYCIFNTGEDIRPSPNMNYIGTVHIRYVTADGSIVYVHHVYMETNVWSS